jgi:hypothetical protein
MKYQDPLAFRSAGIELDVCEYRPIPYEQDAAFVPGLSILDALFHLGKGSRTLLSYSPDTCTVSSAEQAGGVRSSV